MATDANLSVQPRQSWTPQAAITDLTDNSGGTASVTDTLVAMPNPADTPASADALRDDLVANTLPPLRNNIATLTARLQSITEVMRTNGMIVE